MQKHSDLPRAFADLGVEIRFLKALRKIGFETPSDIQEKMIPAALSGKDLLGQARTGTGKTAAFGLPVLQKIDPSGRLQAICLAPTRELAVQVTAELKRFCVNSDLRIVAVYGGQKIATQAHQLGKKPHFVVGTPGRVMDMMQRRMLDITDARFVILDEVDRMLDIGFREDIRMILGQVKAKHQTIFVSATLDDEIKRLAKRYMTDPVEVNVSQDRLTVDDVDQSYVTAERRDKFRLLKILLEREDPQLSIVFTNTKHIARKLCKKLHEAGVNATEIHGDLMQRKRDRVMERFRKHQIKVLVATDLAARGIDVSAVTHIFNYDIPVDPEIYVHRIGRTARMGARGIAITFVSREEGKELTAVESLINREVPQRIVDGFCSQPPKEQPPPHRPSRLEAPIASGNGNGPAKPRPRTLASKFPTRRSRRRR